MISEEDDLYKRIGCTKDATCEQILAEYRQRVLSLHPDKACSSSTETQAGDEPNGRTKKFQELQYAKEVLSEPRRRKHYDIWLAMCAGGNNGLSLKEWMDNQDKIQQTLHWGQRGESQRQLLPDDLKSKQQKDARGIGVWEPNESPMAKAFRNYQI